MDNKGANGTITGRLTLTEAARRTGRQLATIRRWIERGELSSAEAYQKPRFREEAPEWQIDPAALDRVNAAHQQSARPIILMAPPPSAATPVPLASSLANTLVSAQTLELLLAELERLRQQVAHLTQAQDRQVAQGHASARSQRAASVPTHSDDTSHAEEPTLEASLPPRPAPTTAPLALDGWRAKGGRGRVSGARANGVPFPAGWIPFSSWCSKHNLDLRTVERHISKGKLPMPQMAPKNKPWIRNGYQIVRAYDEEQHLQACEAAAHYWPDSFLANCGPECPFTAPSTEREANNEPLSEEHAVDTARVGTPLGVGVSSFDV